MESCPQLTSLRSMTGVLVPAPTASRLAFALILTNFSFSESRRYLCTGSNHAGMHQGTGWGCSCSCTGRGRWHVLSPSSNPTCCYALMERLAPFPTDVLADNVPLQYKLSLAHARATSVHPSCAHAHLITMASSRLHAEKMNYSDLLGVFPNLLMLITGACGDGKSIPLWLDTMIMHMYRPARQAAVRC